jgi:uncharacterized damage-inducible protein DinB
MLTETLNSLFERDLNQLRSEIEAYQNEQNLWKTDKQIANSAGNLTLHIIGNLNWFVGAQLGNTGYVRNRTAELTLTNVPKKDLLTALESTKIMVRETLEKLTSEQLEKDYPIDVFKQNMTTSYFLVHLTTHLAYHLGQINYHRRLLEEA